MEQMGTFMAEYAEWFYMGSSIVILILLIYVLHRIKKTERKNLMMNREIEKRLQQIEKQNRQKETEDRTENEHEKMTGKIRLKEDADLHQTQVLQGLEKGKQNAEGCKRQGWLCRDARTLQTRHSAPSSTKTH